jgi:hypothetical protein
VDVPQVADVVQDGQALDLDEDLGEDGLVGGEGPAGDRVGEGVEFWQDETGF